MPRVFIAEPNERFEFKSAKVYGELIYLSDVRISPFNPTDALLSISHAFTSKKFNPAEDYICMTGNAVILCYMFAVASHLYKSTKILMFDSRTHSYCERICSIKEV